MELQVVNLLHAGTPQERLARLLTRDQARAERLRLLSLLEQLAVVDGRASVEEVEALPGGLCQRWCPVLQRCPAGQAFVAQYAGPQALRRRLAEREA